MATDESSDILMVFIVETEPVAGEATTELQAKGKVKHRFLDEFRPGAMIEVDSFTFAVGLDDQNKGEEEGKKGDKRRKGAMPGPFQDFRKTGKAKVLVNVQPVSVSRAIDRSSTTMMTYFIKNTTFRKVILVKRKAAGSPLAGEPFLRMEFTDVLITNVSWSNEEPVKETMKFISRAVTIQYRPQEAGGTMGRIIPGSWSMLDGSQ